MAPNGRGGGVWFLPPTDGPGEDKRARPARPRAVRFTLKPTQTWVGDGLKADTKRTKFHLRPRAGPSCLSLLPQTDRDEQDRVARWSWPKSNSNGPTQTNGDFIRFLSVWVGRPSGVRPVFHMGQQRTQRADPYVQCRRGRLAAQFYIDLHSNIL